MAEARWNSILLIASSSRTYHAVPSHDLRASAAPLGHTSLCGRRNTYHLAGSDISSPVPTSFVKGQSIEAEVAFFDTASAGRQGRDMAEYIWATADRLEESQTFICTPARQDSLRHD